MGCDIHIIAEVKKDGVWMKNTDRIFPNSWYNPERWNERVSEWRVKLENGDIDQETFDRWVTQDSLEMTEEFLNKPSDDRNYDWFSVLADVRNGRGFAGVYTGAGFDIISEPKGLPDDASVDAKKFLMMPITDDEELIETEIEEDGYYSYYVSREDANRWMKEGYSTLHEFNGEHYVSNPDYHSASYLNVDDFNNFDWNQVTMKYGVVPLEQYKELRKTGESPKDWSGAISGGNIITVSPEEADEIIAGKVTELTKPREERFFGDAIPAETKPLEEWNVHVGYEWGVVYSDWFKHNIENTVEPLRTLKEKYEDARIVFAFDN